jgi:hypothetical protein
MRRKSRSRGGRQTRSPPLSGRQRQTRRITRIPMPGPNQCHPRVKEWGASCFPEEVLRRAVQTLGGGRSRSAPTSKHALVKTLAKNLGVKESDQRTLLQKLPLPEEETKELASKYLRPAMPEAWKEDPDMWLDSNNIRDVMKQYEEAYPDFKFLGPYPIDFAAPEEEGSDRCLIGEMCSLDLDKEELKGKTKFGIIFNLDPHDKGGSHWVAAYIDSSKKTCYYFDSYGLKPPSQIYKFMQWLGLQEPEIQLGWNGRQFQRQNTECGMYCMYFIDRMIAGEPYLKFCRRAPPDRFMLDLRDWMFST